MDSQYKEIGPWRKYLHLCRQHEWILGTPLRYLQGLLAARHRVVSRKAYYHEALGLLGRSPQLPLAEYQRELVGDEFCRRSYLEAIEHGKIPKKYDRYEDRCRNEANLVNYYALVRELKPRVIVETGTATGSMTSWILAALHRNRMGKLISIDIPPQRGQLTMDMTVAKAEVGFLIPREYHNRWEYLVGDAKVLLPRVLTENDVDIFVHDSLHTRTHMLFEYHVARTLMRPGTVILSDDIMWNKAFCSFVASHNLRSLGCIANPNLGLTVNWFDDYELRIGVGVVST